MSNADRNPIQTYALVVCFTALFAGAAFLVTGLYDVIEISFPEATNPNTRSLELEALQEDAIRKIREHALREKKQRNEPEKADPQAENDENEGPSISIIASSDQYRIASNPAVRTLRQPIPNYRSSQPERHVNKALQSLIRAGIGLLICVAVFSFHWRMVKATS